ncbi:MAG TPA: GGDEF domain-containing protein [Steroidobacteraceae bacterium]|nr:GGDEF domain-containing protein [Steroidobacteraceae bacterium]
MPRRRFTLTRTSARTTARLRPGGLALLLLFVSNYAAAIQPDEAARLLRKADTIKLSSYGEFAAIVQSLEQQSKDLSVSQREYLRYFQGWKSAYDGDYDTAISKLEALRKESSDLTLQLRADATAVNVLALAKRYEGAYSRLTRVLGLLPRVADKDAREQALMDAAELYNLVGQNDLGLHYAQTVIDENWAGRGLCRGGRMKLQALFQSARIKAVSPEIQAGIDACVKSGELFYANIIRMYGARVYIDAGQLDDGIKLLTEHYDEVKQSHYSLLLSQFDALLAEAYRRKGIPTLARQFALNAAGNAVTSQHQYTEPLVTAYRLLYELARQQGDFKLALAFHEKFVDADKGYLDDESARQLAYDKVTHEAIANQLQIASLNKQYQVLQLQKTLGAEAVENGRLWIALLMAVVLFIGLWAYRTKRSQLHFMTVSQLDGLTGICNRPHFINQAEKALEYSRKTQQELCLVLCDLDHFKSINDRHGHATGDFVLRQTVSTCRVHLRADEVFGRFGGEEFSILLPGSDSQTARQRAEHLRMVIAEISAGSGNTESKVSASFGIASTASSGYELKQLLAHADAALYQAKRDGRNRVVTFDATAEADKPAVIPFDEQQVYTPRSSAML